MAAFCQGATHSQVSEANRQSANQDEGATGDGGAGLGLSIQTFHILSKILEADKFVFTANGNGAQSLSVKTATFECHPELAFLALSDTDSTEQAENLTLRNTQALWSKKTHEGRRRRIELLCREGGLDAQKVLSLAKKEEYTGAEVPSNAIEIISQMRTWHIPSLTEEAQGLISVAADDVLDAMVCAISSQKRSRGRAKAVQEEGERQLDKRDIPMVIWV
ncbi:hypothetical protein CBS101457_006110 [Exobasidium rhododendri]|nr:hypothetical protein CBS101457_006110 [Exobasidium rhododendri]